MPSTPESYPRFTRETVTPDPALLDSIAASWIADSEKEIGKSPLLSGAIIFGFYAALGAGLGLFVDPQWLMWVICGLGGLLTSGIVITKSRASYRDLLLHITDLKTATLAIRHTLDLSGPHRFVFHEHGLIVLAPLAPGRTFVHDISSCADHPWDDPVSAAYESKTLKSRWAWYDIVAPSGKKFEALGFAMGGPPLVPVVRNDFANADELGAFVDLFGDEWLPQDYVAKLDFDQLITEDEAVQKRHTATSSASR
jgi:hypothetical protein